MVLVWQIADALPNLKNFSSKKLSYYTVIILPSIIMAVATQKPLFKGTISKLSCTHLCSCVHVSIPSPGGVVIITTPASPLPTELVATTDNL